ncbi:MAG: hypothetical protein ACRDMH_01360 [Solirubrobacterales bacterium]
MAQALSSVPARTPITNGPVNAIAATPQAIYIGGSFSHVGPNTGPGVGVDAATGRNSHWPMVASEPGATPRVWDAAPDGSGGFYVAGDFTRVGGRSLGYLVHLRADGSIDRRFAPAPDGRVFDLVVSGSTVYAVGGFTTIGGQSRDGLAALNARTGAATSWDPAANGIEGGIEAIAVWGSTVYVGGAIREIEGQPRNHVAALDVSTGALEPWNPPDVRGVIDALAVSSSTVYIGKESTHIGNMLDAVDRSTGKTIGIFHSYPTGAVRDLVVKGSRLYVAGSFSTMLHFRESGDVFIPRPSLASYNTTTGELTHWNPRPDDGVSAIAISGSKVYAAGDFTEVRGKSRDHLAAINRWSGVPTAWNPSADSAPSTIAVSGSTVYTGGSFNSVGGKPRDSLAALSPTTGTLMSWNPKVSPDDFPRGDVEALAVHGSTVYAGGAFHEIGGQPRSNLAAIDRTTGAPTSWNPGANHTVSALAASDNAIYAGGEFTSVGGEVRNNLAKIDLASGDVTDWDPNVTTTKHYPQYPNYFPSHQCIGDDPCLFTLVDAIAVAGSRVYVGGIFDHVAGKPRGNIAALDATTGAAKSWSPDASGGGSAGGYASGMVAALRVSGPIVYAGGDFAQIGGEPRANLAALNTADGSATNWDPSVSFHGGDTIISAIAVKGPNVYVGGTFDKVGATARDNLAAVNASSGTSTSWNPSAEFPQTYLPFYVAATSLALAPDGSLWAGGRFSFFPAAPAAGIARFEP